MAASIRANGLIGTSPIGSSVNRSGLCRYNDWAERQAEDDCLPGDHRVVLACHRPPSLDVDQKKASLILQPSCCQGDGFQITVLSCSGVYSIFGVGDVGFVPATGVSCANATDTSRTNSTGNAHLGGYSEMASISSFHEIEPQTFDSEDHIKPLSN